MAVTQMIDIKKLLTKTQMILNISDEEFAEKLDISPFLLETLKKYEFIGDKEKFKKKINNVARGKNV